MVSFGVAKEEVERKIKNLTCHFSREVKKKKYSVKSGTGNEELYNSVSSRQEILSWSSFLDLSWFSSQENGNVLIICWLDSRILDNSWSWCFRGIPFLYRHFQSERSSVGSIAFCSISLIDKCYYSLLQERVNFF